MDSKYSADFSSVVAYDEASPTFLRWIKPRLGRGGKPVARKNSAAAGWVSSDGCLSFNWDGGLYSNKNVIWILHNGPIPDGRQVVLADGDAKNLNISNMYLSYEKGADYEKYGKHLSEFFEYDESSPSCLRWKKASSPNSNVKPGDVAGGLDTSCGYWNVNALGEKYKVHKIVWALLKGACQDGMYIDHFDRDRSNNKIENLRLVENEVNQRNRSKNKNNTSGVTGVSFSERYGSTGYFSKYTASCYGSDGKSSKTFSIQKYGDEGAFKMAVEWRDNMIAELNAQGAGYTDAHGT